MKLYSGRLSLFTAKVRTALREKELAFETITVPFRREVGYGPKPPELLAINPKGQVPVLVDGDVAVYDSTIILEYLEERYPERPLYPKDLKERVRCRQLEAAADEILFPRVLVLVEEVFRKPDPAQRDGARIEAAILEIDRLYDQLDGALAGREYVCGGFSVADIAYFLTVSFATYLGAPLPSSARNLEAWFARVAARPSLRREAEEMTAAAQELAA